MIVFVTPSTLRKTLISVLAILVVGFVSLLGFNTQQAHAQTASGGQKKSISNCLGVKALPLNDLCITTNYTVFSPGYAQISSVKECVSVMGPASYASIGTTLDIYTQNTPKREWRGSQLIYGPIGAASDQCATFWPWQVVKLGQGNVGVWVGATGFSCPNFNPNEVCSLEPGGTMDLIAPEWIDTSNFS